MQNPLTQPVQVRPVRAEDLKTIHQLEDASFKDPFPAYFIDQLAEVNPNTFLVALASDQVVGYAVVDNWIDHQHLVSIAVRAESRRRGVAQALLNQLFQRLQPGPFRLELRRSNKAALALYQKNGFTLTGIAHSYYADGEDALQMEKPILEKVELLASA